jgi:protein-disulfide isomerase
MSNDSGMSKRQLRREKMRRDEARSRLVTIGLVVLAAVVVAFVLIIPNFQPVASVTTITPRARPQAKMNSAGDPNAPVKLEEFSDFQCPYCKRFYEETEGQIEDTYVAAGKVYFTYRSAGNWVSGNIGGGKTESQDAARAAYCAGDQGKYWEMHDMLFANVIGEDAGSFVDRRLVAIAKAAGLDMTKFNDCYNSTKYADTVAQDGKDTIAAGVQGTPSFVISYNDASGKTVTKLIEGAQPFDTFKQEIESALAKAGK